MTEKYCSYERCGFIKNEVTYPFALSLVEGLR